MSMSGRQPSEHPTDRRARTQTARLQAKRRLSARLPVLLGVIAALGGVVALAQISTAADSSPASHRGPSTCTTAPTNPTTAPAPTETTPSSTEAAEGTHNHNGDGQRRGSGSCQPSSSPTTPAPVVQADAPGKSCDNSLMEVHDGFQNGNRCVAVDRGEVPVAENSPSLLIVSAPRIIRINRPFEIRISTRNLVRNFFQPAGTGGYFNNRSMLNEEGIVEGHVHTSIRPLPSTRVAPDAAPVPTFFKATEDGLGGRTPDTFVVQVPGIATPGIYQITSWCGDASHGVPMNQRANQNPCVDVVRLIVTR
jgi:hypothetical protein